MSNDALTHPTDAAAAGHALVEAATTAGYAPSIHNTQPWHWRLTDHTLHLYLERRRVLDVTDPDTRLATLSCGAALHHARVSLAAQGWHVTATRMPDRADPDHLARLSVEGRVPVESSAALHLRTVPLRQTDRRPVTGAPVGPRGTGGHRRRRRSRGHVAAHAAPRPGPRTRQCRRLRPAHRGRRVRLAGRARLLDRRDPTDRHRYPRRRHPRPGHRDHGARSRLRPSR